MKSWSFVDVPKKDIALETNALFWNVGIDVIILLMSVLSFSVRIV